MTRIVDNSFGDLAWTFEGVETTPGDPAALAGWPTVGLVDRVRMLLAEAIVLDAMPADIQLRWALGLFAITEGVTRRGEDPTSPQVRDRLLAHEDAWEERNKTAWPQRFGETDEQREQRHRAIARWRNGEGESN